MSESSKGIARAPSELGNDVDDVAALRSSPGYVRVRRRARVFTFVCGGLVLAWFFVLLWFSGYQRDVLAVRIWGQLSFGMVLAWSQVVTTILVGVLCMRHYRRLDAEVSSLRGRGEGSDS